MRGGHGGASRPVEHEERKKHEQDSGGDDDLDKRGGKQRLKPNEAARADMTTASP